MTPYIPRSVKGEKQHKTKFLPSDDASDAVDKYLRRISFSFHFLQIEHPKFSIVDRKFSYFETLIARLKQISGMERKHLAGSSGYNNKTLRYHPFLWEETTEKGFGIPDEGHIVEEPIQLCSLSQGEHGRVHGFFIENVFFIVWLDPHHRLISGKKR